MLENELIALWQSSPKHERIKFEKSRLLLDVQSKLDSFDRAIKRRDIIEISLATIGVPFFAYQAYRLPSVMAKAGAILIVVWCLYVIYKLLDVKKTKPNETNSYLDYLKGSREYLNRHKSLLENILYWYILPCLIGCVMIMIGQLNLLGKPWQEVLRNRVMWRSFFIFMVAGVFTFWLNKRAIKKEFLPRLEKVDELIALMEEE